MNKASLVIGEGAVGRVDRPCDADIAIVAPRIVAVGPVSMCEDRRNPTHMVHATHKPVVLAVTAPSPIWFARTAHPEVAA
jgi:hypothetical protein